jgi:hypothetical protein
MIAHGAAAERFCLVRTQLCFGRYLHDMPKGMCECEQVP